MNTAYPQQAHPPHDLHRGSIPSIQEAYRAGPPLGPPYPLPQHPAPVPQQPHVNPSYTEPFNPLAVSRAPPPEQIHAEGGLAPLAPGTQPTAPEPLPRSNVDENGWRYELKVVQQPQRARMCGFGDKDRRPITPPPCVRLVITDSKTGKEIDLNDIDHGMFVLNVDLHDQNGTKEVNLVRHLSNSPSLPGALGQNSYPDSSPASAPASYHSILPVHNAAPVKFEQGSSYGQQQIAHPYSHHSQPPPGPPPPPFNPQYQGSYPPSTNGAPPYPPQNGYSQPPSQPGMFYQPPPSMQHGHGPGEYPPSQFGGRQFPPTDMNMQRLPMSTAPPGGMFTRNLIGSLAASAFRLTDPDDRIGIWFVLQDLSVRTEGVFRLRFSFVNVGASSASAQTGGQPITQVNQSKAPVLASCFSDAFQVFSAKRFPGVVESTQLSRCFATQGIKIPIRKDGQGPGRGDRDREYDDD